VRARARWIIDLVDSRDSSTSSRSRSWLLFGKVGLGRDPARVFALEWLYPVYFEAAWHGATPASACAGSRCCATTAVRSTGVPR
jgi:hypothetical protein